MRDASPTADTEKLAGILAAQHDGRSAGVRTTSRRLPARKPRAWKLTTRPGTTVAGPLILGARSARAGHAAAQQSAIAIDVLTTSRCTATTVAERHEAIP